jgi:hypothetical protein
MDKTFAGDAVVPRKDFKFAPIELAAEADLVDIKPGTADAHSLPVAPVAEKVKPAVVRDDRIDELGARITILENLLRPALAPAGKLDKIRMQYLSLAGNTDLSFDQFRCLPRLRREAMLAGAA